MEEGIAHIIYGRNPLREALNAGVGIDKVFFLQGEPDSTLIELRNLVKAHHIPFVFVAKSRLSFIAGTSSHQGVVAKVSVRAYKSIGELLRQSAEKHEPPFLLACFQLQDPQNLGSLLRTGEATGIDGIIIPQNKSVGLSPTVSKVSSGADSYVPVARVTNLYETLLELKEKGMTLIGAHMGGDTHYRAPDYTAPLVIVLGGEGRGLDRRLLSICDYKVHIPLRGKLNSLNVGVAGALLLYEVLFQRTGKKNV